MVQTRVDGRILGILAAVSALFLGFGVFIWTRQSDGWQFAAAAAVVLAPFWTGALSVRFRFDHYELDYRSLFRRLHVVLYEVAAVEIVAERGEWALQGAPRFYLVLRNGARERLNIRILPLRAVRELCELFRLRNVPITVQNAFAAKRMAAEILEESPSERAHPAMEIKHVRRGSRHVP